ncbi:MAG: lytic transglycosylase domain-containing protein [Gemmatimonadota bacterium]|nr:lytic transglycosylase domain-containing protein [Gemmatimonadota bacterium]
MTERRRDAIKPVAHNRARRIALAAVRFVVLAVLLAAGTVWTLQNQRALVKSRAMTLPVSLVQPMKPTEEAFRIGQFLGRYTKDSGMAFRVADALVREGHRQNISPELLVGVVLTEDPELNPRARSHVGARGIMQVMPFHSGKWGCGSGDLFDVEANICHGVKILKQAIADTPNMRVALLRYNGCVRGKNTRDCHSYDDKVLRHVDRTQEAIRLLRLPQGE